MPPILTSDFVTHYRQLSDSITHAVAVVTVGHGARFTGVTVDSFLDVSWDPPTMLVSVLTLSRVMEVMGKEDAFTLSLLSAHQREIASWLGAPGQPNYGLLSGIACVAGTHGPAHIAQCAAFFEIRISDRHQVATHTLLSGPVVAQGGDPDREPLTRRNRVYSS